MPSYIVKINPEEDGYVLWSTVTDSPHFWGSRTEVWYHLLYTGNGGGVDELDARFARADSTGTSAMHGDFGWGDGFIVEQRGWLNREDLQEFLESFDESTQTFNYELLKPFGD